MASSQADLNSTFTPENKVVEVLLNEAFPDLLVVWFHSGGGIYGFHIEHNSGNHVFWGAPDSTWGYDRFQPDGSLIEPNSFQTTTIPSTGFDPHALVEEIKTSVETHLL